MKLPSRLIKGLSKEQTDQLERELKSSLLAKQLRKALKEDIESLYKQEEFNDTAEFNQYVKALGERRGYRAILNLIPEE